MTFSRSRYDTQIKLSPEELFEISQEISRKFAPTIPAISPDSALLSAGSSNRHLPRNPTKSQANAILHASHYSRTQLSPQEIFEISREISRKFAPNASTGTPELVLLPVDPHHLYAYWNLGENKKPAKPKAEPANPLILRIYWRPDESADTSNTKIWFDVALHTFQSRQKVRLPIDGTAYSAAIGRLDSDNSLTVFADSNIIHVPCDKMRPSPVQRPPVQRKGQLPAAETAPPPVLHNQAAEALGFEHRSEQALFYTQTDDIRCKKGINQRLSPGTDGNNEILFFSKMKTMLYEKDINKQLIPKTNASETFYYNHKNASGQGR